MPTTLPGISVAAGAGAAADAGPGAQVVPGGGARVRQGRPRRHLDRPGAVLDDGDHGHPQAGRGVAGQARAGTPDWAPDWLKPVLRPIWPDRISWDELVDEMDRALRIPGVTNAWTMPIKARIDMLTTGVRTPVGIKIFGADLAEIERIGERDRGASAGRPGHAQRLRRARGRRLLRRLRCRAATSSPATASPSRRSQDGDHDRDRRRERHHDDRGARALPGQRPLPARAARRPRPARPRAGADAAGRRRSRWPSSPTSSSLQGPAMLRDENGFLAGYVYVDIAGRDIGGYVEEAKKLVRGAARRCRRATSCSGAASTRTCCGSASASRSSCRSRSC